MAWFFPVGTLSFLIECEESIDFTVESDRVTTAAGRAIGVLLIACLESTLAINIVNISLHFLSSGLARSYSSGLSKSKLGAPRRLTLINLDVEVEIPSLVRYVCYMHTKCKPSYAPP